MFYKDAKVYNDGSHYIAIPHTTNPTKRRKIVEEPVEIAQENEVETDFQEQPEVQDVEIQEDAFADMIPVECDELPFDDPPPKPKRKLVKRSDVFEELYEKALDMKHKSRRNYLYKNMRPFFDKQQDCEEYVDMKLDAKRRSMIARKTRFIRKAYMNKFNFFVTFTYDNAKHTEDTFKKKLSMCLSTFQKRKGWRYMGVWERAPKTKRLHFHGLFLIPEGTLPGDMIERKDYNLNSHKMQLTMQNSYFNTRFGRNDFEPIDEDLVKMGNAMAYILKYIEKTHEKIVYSRGLPVYIISDINEKDVLCNIGIEDKKLLLQDKFMCYNDGELLGEISQETKTQLRTSN